VTDNDQLAFDEFLETYPPGSEKTFEDLAVSSLYAGRRLKTPELLLECPNPICDGPRLFAYDNEEPPASYRVSNHILVYRCKNCGSETKTFAIQSSESEDGRVSIIKIGEWPPFGPKLPSKLVTLLRDDKDLFIKGRRAENQGLGIGAFAYYRRVVENQKDKLIDQIVHVAKQIGGMDEVISELSQAKQERQFSKAVEKIKHVIPQSLLIKSHNPLLLLHNALSEGLHAETDEDCLKSATDIRIVLTDLSEKLANALSDNKELDDAVKRLAAKK
jgi:hypothetical protein